MSDIINYNNKPNVKVTYTHNKQDFTELYDIFCSIIESIISEEGDLDEHCLPKGINRPTRCDFPRSSD